MGPRAGLDILRYVSAKNDNQAQRSVLNNKEYIRKKCAIYNTVQSRGAQNFQKPGCHLKIQGARRVP